MGDDAAEIMERQLRDPFPDVRDLSPTTPEAFQILIARASKKRPEDRYPSAEKMLAAVESLLEQPAEKTTPRPTPRKPTTAPTQSSSAETSVVELESRLALARKTSDSSTQLETLRSLYGLYAQLDRRDDALRAFREALALHVKMQMPGNN
jgi:hypothetical protein